MASKLTRLTFAVTKDIENLLNYAKRELFYNNTRSEMIRVLVAAGLGVFDKNNNDEKQHEVVS